MINNKKLILANFKLQNEETFPSLELAYRTYGELNSQGNNAILFPTYYTGTDLDNAKIIGANHALDPTKYFIIVPNLFGNGISSSPSNTPAPFNGTNFPNITLYDNVRAQHQLIDYLNVTSLKLVLGWSMGGMQTYQWCAQYPNIVKNALIICATAKTSEHNHVFLEGVKAALTADTKFNHGNYRDNPPVDGLKAFARVYAGWAYSQQFYREQKYKDLGFNNAEELLKDWEQDHLNWDANDLLTMLNTWQTSDISQQSSYDADLEKALTAIKANVILMPCEQDLYFRFEDNQSELNHLKYGSYQGFESSFGHCSAGPGRLKRESELIDTAISRLLKD